MTVDRKAMTLKSFYRQKSDTKMTNYVIGNLGEVIEKATHRESVPEIPLKQRKLTARHLVVGR